MQGIFIFVLHKLNSLNDQQPKHIDEQSLIIWLKQKDKDALAYLYDHYAPALYGIIKRVVKTEEVAEEVLQDTFIRIWDKIHSYDQGKGKLFTWMLNIARNLAIDKLRSKEFSRKNKTDQLENSVSFINSNIYVEQKIKDTGLRDLLHSLSPEQQMIINLVYFEGYTHTEVSEEFDIPLGTVKTRLRSALIRLRKLLNIS